MPVNSYQAKTFLNLDLPLQVCRSNAGFYLGSMMPSGEPCSRDSGYYPTREEAQSALDSGNFEQRMTP